MGRPSVLYRTVLDGILYIVRTGCHSKLLPKEYGSVSTAADDSRGRSEQDIFQKLWDRLLEICDDIHDIN